MISITKTIARGMILCLVGVSFAFVLNLLQIQRHLPPVKRDLSALLNKPWWIPVVSGVGSAIVGLLFPYLDRKLGEHQVSSQEWSAVMKCMAMFVGINHASAKIDFASNLQLSISLTVLSITLWWVFDRTRSGFVMGVTIAVLATFITQLLVHNGVYNYTERDFMYVRSWLPCVVFTGGITIGNIGRQLASISIESEVQKRHNE